MYFLNGTICNFPGENGVVVNTSHYVFSRFVDFDPLAKIVDKNTFQLEAQSRGSVFNAILCEKGKIIADTTGYTYRSLLTLQHTPMSPY